MVAAAYTLGFAGMVWLYPLLAANFFCLPRGSATTVNLICVGAILPVLYQDPYMGSRVLAASNLPYNSPRSTRAPRPAASAFAQPTASCFS